MSTFQFVSIFALVVFIIVVAVLGTSPDAQARREAHRRAVAACEATPGMVFVSLRGGRELCVEGRDLRGAP